MTENDEIEFELRLLVDAAMRHHKKGRFDMRHLREEDRTRAQDWLERGRDPVMEALRAHFKQLSRRLCMQIFDSSLEVGCEIGRIIVDLECGGDYRDYEARCDFIEAEGFWLSDVTCSRLKKRAARGGTAQFMKKGNVNEGTV